MKTTEDFDIVQAAINAFIAYLKEMNINVATHKAEPITDKYGNLLAVKLTHLSDNYNDFTIIDIVDTPVRVRDFEQYELAEFGIALQLNSPVHADRINDIIAELLGFPKGSPMAQGLVRAGEIEVYHQHFMDDKDAPVQTRWEREFLIIDHDTAKLIAKALYAKKYPNVNAFIDEIESGISRQGPQVEG